MELRDKMWAVRHQEGCYTYSTGATQFGTAHIQNFQNVPASGVHAPLYEVHAPPTGNPGSVTDIDQIGVSVETSKMFQVILK